MSILKRLMLYSGFPFEHVQDVPTRLNPSIIQQCVLDAARAHFVSHCRCVLLEVNDGISTEFATYLEQMTDKATGLYAGRKESTDSNMRRIEQRILSLESRLEQKEDTLRAKFSAMESLISGMNSQSTFLAQQLASLPQIGGSKN